MQNILKNIFVSVEGNIGTGKSTFLDILNKKLQKSLESKKILIIKEPVSDWQDIKDPYINDNGNQSVNLLEMFYKNPERWGYTFQSYAFFSRLKENHKLFKNIQEQNLKYDFSISERSILSDKHIFAENSFQQGMLTVAEKRIYDNWFQFLNDTIAQKYNGHIYLKCDPKISYERIQIRSRKGENLISLDYLESLHNQHENWLKDKQNVVTINVNEDFLNDQENQKKIINNTIKFLINLRNRQL